MPSEERLAQIREIVGGNSWWVTSSGAHLNMADELLEEVDDQAATMTDLQARIAALESALSLALEQLELDADGSPCSCEGELCRYCQARAALPPPPAKEGA